MRHFELPGARSVPAPLLDRLAIFGELQDARIAATGAVAIGDEDIAIRRDGDGIRLVEGIEAIACWDGRAA